MLSKPMRGARPNRQHWSAKGLVGEWLFNEGCGTKAFDSSGNGNHGTLINMASPPTASSGWCAGRKGGGLRFDGSNDYVNCGNDSSLNTYGTFAIEAWVKGSPGIIIGKHYLYFEVHITTRIVGYKTGETSYCVWKTIADNYINSNEWTHIVVIFLNDAKYPTVYVNGLNYPCTLHSHIDCMVGHTPTLLTALTIGRRTGGSSYFNGQIDGMRLYHRALSSKEVAWDYINEYARYQPRLTLTQLRYFVELGVITDPSIESLSVNRTIESLTPERTFNLGV